MPTISEFYGILILMFYEDHPPPHFHARYGEYEAFIQISPIEVLKGNLPLRALNLVLDWAKIHREKLIETWNHAANYKKLQKIPPLQ